MIKYMPLSLSVRRPINRASVKLKKLARRITRGRASSFPSKADVYTPTPKKAAVAREIYRVGPEKIVQLTVRMTNINMVVNDTIKYGGNQSGRVASTTKTAATNAGTKPFL
jgi:hypothetical protein